MKEDYYAILRTHVPAASVRALDGAGRTPLTAIAVSTSSLLVVILNNMLVCAVSTTTFDTFSCRSPHSLDLEHVMSYS